MGKEGTSLNKYLLIVYGPPAENEAERSAGMAMMAEWYGSLGPALVDPGAPFVGARTVSDGAVDEGPNGPNPTGYNVVQAGSLDEATELAQRCPLLRHGRRITVLETFAM